jgi:hypothetical protein
MIATNSILSRRPFAWFRGSALALAAVACIGNAVAASPVVRPAPDFSYTGAGGRKTLRNLRNQPVVVVITASPDTKAFRKQAKALAPIYQEFASRGTVFVAAFSEKEGQIPSDIPFVVAANGAAVANAYGHREDITIAVIGRDGNLDFITDKVVPAFRIREVIQNSYVVQQAARKEIPKGPPQ